MKCWNYSDAEWLPPVLVLMPADVRQYRWLLLHFFLMCSPRLLKKWSKSGPMSNLTWCPIKRRAPTSWRAPMKHPSCWMTTSSWRRACPSPPSKRSSRRALTRGKASSGWLRYAHTIPQRPCVFCVIVRRRLASCHCPLLVLCRTCWRSGWPARDCGCTWSPSSAPMTSTSSCRSKGNGTSTWRIPGGESWRAPFTNERSEMLEKCLLCREQRVWFSAEVSRVVEKGCSELKTCVSAFTFRWSSCVQTLVY